jgi:hypothetical protein
VAQVVGLAAHRSQVEASLVGIGVGCVEHVVDIEVGGVFSVQTRVMKRLAAQ